MREPVLNRLQFPYDNVCERSWSRSVAFGTRGGEKNVERRNVERRHSCTLRFDKYIS